MFPRDPFVSCRTFRKRPCHCPLWFLAVLIYGLGVIGWWLDAAWLQVPEHQLCSFTLAVED